MIKKIAIALVFAALAVPAVGYVLPRSWSVQRSVVIRAAPERIYPLLVDLRRWQDWSVWTRAMDPLVRNSYEGPREGVGARWIWMGPQMGRGQLEITSASLRQGIELAQAIESERVNAKASLRLVTEGDGTRVTWTDEGSLPLVVGGFFRGTVEALLGQHLQASLEKLKAVVEALPVKPAAPLPAPADAGVQDAGVDDAGAP